MELERFIDAMHPAAEHNYSIDFTDLLQGIGGSTEVITGTPVITVVKADPGPGPIPAGFSAVYQGLDATSRKVIFKAGIATGEHGNAIYDAPGQVICVQADIVTTSSPAEVQQGELVVVNPC
jgi:hypothetical protein